ncbi:MAG: FAD-dependent oxidoreductase [Dehalococcoidia bacterium]|nr:FAD-dependent oxidoreductase [Dehalococcoidia bacterium]
MLIATGASPVVPSIEGAHLPGISPFWYADDARKVYDLANSAKQVAVVGAGFVGLQVLDCLLRQGKSIWLIETLDHLLPNVLDPGGAEIVLERLLQKGVHVHLKDKVYSIREAGKKKLLSITSGGTLKVDLVIFATGTRPNVDFLKRSGIKVSRGVIVDDYCRTSAEGIYAAGDVTESIDPVTEKVGANPTWPNAVEQGWTAGLNMAGREVTRRRRIRSNVFTISDLCCASVGLVSGTNKGYSEFVQKTGSTYRKLIFKDNSLVGAILVGDIEDAGVLNHFIELQKIFPESKIEMVKPDEIASVAGALCSWAGNHTQ